MSYDSLPDTLKHIRRVNFLMLSVCIDLQTRAQLHDWTKLEKPEKPIFDKYTPLLANSEYGSDEYKSFLTGMGEALQHHYQTHSHHPEHFENGINGMSLLDLIEMFCDWKAAGERHKDGSLEKSIEHNRTRFGMSEQLVQIFKNTQKELNW